MPNTSQLQPTVVSCYGGLVLNRDIFTMRPGEALQLTNFEPDIEGGYKKVQSIGTGPVDAVCKAIDKIIEIPVNLTEFSVNSVTQGIDSLGEVTIRISDNLGQIFSGRGSDADIVVSSAKAYVNAINRMITIREESSNSTIEK